MATIKLAQARAQISKLVEDIEFERAVVLEKRGKPAAILLSIKEYERLKSNQKIEFGEYDLGEIKGTLRREDIYGEHPRLNSV